MKRLAASVSRRDRRVLIAGGAIILALVTLSRGVPIWLAWTGDARASADELAEALALAEASVDDAPRARRALEQRNARFLSLAPILVEGRTPAIAAGTLAGLVSSAAVAAGVRIASVHLRADSTRRGTFACVAVEAEIVGDVRGMSAFVATLERGPALLAVRELAITQPDATAPPDRAEALRARLVVEGLALNRTTAAEGDIP